MIKIVKTEQSHVDELKKTMRPSDREECTFVSNGSPEEALQQTFDTAKYCYTGIDDSGNVVGIYGATRDTNLPLTHGIVFLLGSTHIESLECAKMLLKEARKFIRSMLGEYKILWNYIPSDRKQTLNWLKRLGFSTDKQFTVNNKEFVIFTINRKVYYDE